MAEACTSDSGLAGPGAATIPFLPFLQTFLYTLFFGTIEALDKLLAVAINLIHRFHGSPVWRDGDESTDVGDVICMGHESSSSRGRRLRLQQQSLGLNPGLVGLE